MDNQAATARRADIDALRAVAVLAVILHHADSHWIRGGFLGVDIFFVISGFLITAHIEKAIAGGRFSFPSFYLRRIRRLFPALAATLVLSSVFSFFLLPPNLLVDFAESQVATNAYVANLYFFEIADYFDTESVLKPLLHTWSLSVEEQFYLAWPLLIFLVRGRKAAYLIATLSLASLAAAQWVGGHYPSATFYLLPFRVFEFGIGALISRFALPELSLRLKQTLTAFSLGVIGAPLIFLDETSNLPGLLSLPVTLATASIILLHPSAEGRARWATRAIARIGLTSYSAYLIHWPLIVFYKLGHNGTLQWFDGMGIVACSLIGGELLFRSVESPGLRLRLSKHRWLLCSLIPGMLGVSLLFLWAVQPQATAATQLNPGNGSGARPTLRQMLDQVPDRASVIKDAEAAISQLREKALPADVPVVLVLGDSHARDIQLALQMAWATQPVRVELYHSICDPLDASVIPIPMTDLYRDHPQKEVHDPQFCTDFHQTFAQRVVAKHPRMIIFAEAWREATLPFLGDTVSLLAQESGAEVIVLGRIPQFVGTPEVIFRRFADVEALESNAWTLRYKRFDGMDSQLAEISAEAGAEFISKGEILCPNGKCTMVHDAQITYADSQHLSIAGMRLMGGALTRNPALAAVLKQDH